MPRLRDDIIKLVSTFGLDCRCHTEKAKTSSSGIVGRHDVYIITFAPDFELLTTLKRKHNVPTELARRITIRKIEKLEKSGVIKGYSVIVDDDLYDKSTVYATIELKVTPQRDCGFDDIAKTIMMYDEVESVSLMSSGAYDLAVEVKGDNLKDVAFFVSERLATIDGILSTSTHFILKKYKEKGIFIDSEEPDERGLV